MTSKLLSVPLLCLLIGMRSFAQPPEEIPWLSDSSRAIQFGIGDYFSVRTFDSKSISLKVHRTALEAVRVALALSGSADRITRDVSTYVNDTLVSSASTSLDPTYSLTLELSAHYLWYIGTNSDVFLFLGTGPVAEYSRKDYASPSYLNYTTSWAVGVGTTVGAEWFVTGRISLHAEYQAVAQYALQRSKISDYTIFGGRQGTEIRESSTMSWRFVSEKVLFGLSVYF